MRREKWEALTQEEQESFALLVPDFVVEVRSPTDSLRLLEEKMADYINNGLLLGWLIDPKSRVVFVYRPDRSPERLDSPETVSADPILPGFVLNVSEIW